MRGPRRLRCGLHGCANARIGWDRDHAAHPSQPTAQSPASHIALTAAAFPEDRMRCLEAGMNDYVAKPVDTEHLVNALRRAGDLVAAKTRNEFVAKTST